MPPLAGNRVEAVRPDGSSFLTTILEVHQDLFLLKNCDPPLADGAHWQCHEHCLRPLHPLEGMGYGMVVIPQDTEFITMKELKGRIAAARGGGVSQDGTR